MGQLTNQYVSQSYQGLLNLSDANTGITTNLQYVTDGLGNNLPLQVSSTEIQIYGLQDTSVTGSLNVSGQLTASGLNYPTADNGVGSFIQTDGGGNLSLQYVKTMYEEVKSRENVVIPKGHALFVSGNTGNRADVYLADATNPNRRPATLIAAADIQPNGNGQGIILGLIDSINVGSLPAGTEIYLGTNGDFTATRPTGSAMVQILGYVSRTGTNGAGYVLNPGPATLPNLASGYTWVGNASGYPTQTLFSAGSSGTSGTSGVAGSSGTSGTSGQSGSSGTSGTSGQSGSSGSSGTSGVDGSSGTSGTSGINGSSGTSGIDGSSGTSGTSGIDGSSGTSGTSGIDGSSGTSGTSGDSIFAQTGSVWATTRNIEITGSLSVSGSINKIEGNTYISGAIINNASNNGLIFITSEASLSSSVKPLNNWYTSNAISSSNIVLDGVVRPANQTGSVFITGSNNIFGGGTASTVTGYNRRMNGNNNYVLVMPTLGTGSVLQPTYSNNYINSGPSMVFTSSSLAAPTLTNNNFFGTLTVNHQSGSLTYNGNYQNGAVISNQNVTPALDVASVIQNNINASITLNHISSSIQSSNNLIFGGSDNSHTLNNFHSSSLSVATNGINFNNNILGGRGTQIYWSGSNATAQKRAMNNNIIGGYNTIISSSHVGSDNGHLIASVVWGQQLFVSASQQNANGGAAFFGRYNDSSVELTDSRNNVFVVGTGTGNTTRRTGFWIDSGSNATFSGSLSSRGNVSITGSIYVSNIPSGSTSDQYVTYNTSTNQLERVTFTGGTSIDTSSFATTGSNQFNGNQSISGSINASGSITFENGTVIDIDNSTTNINVRAGIGGWSALVDDNSENWIWVDDNGAYIGTDQTGTAPTWTFQTDGEMITPGAVTISGSAYGLVNSLGVTSNTASLDLSLGNFFTLQLISGSDVRIESSNLRPGQTVNLLLYTTGSGTVSFDTSFKQPSGSAYVPTTTTGEDILTLVSYDSSSLYLVSVKDFV